MKKKRSRERLRFFMLFFMYFCGIKTLTRIGWLGFFCIFATTVISSKPSSLKLNQLK